MRRMRGFRGEYYNLVKRTLTRQPSGATLSLKGRGHVEKPRKSNSALDARKACG